MTIKELKDKWNKEKNTYRTQEVGSGVQKFVKDILKSEEIFNLKEGLKSTALTKRKNEFLEEEKTKERRQVDIIIYISQDIIIPVEIEKYGNIDAGVSQIIRYKTDLDKKYGILTDGFTWRFYTDNIFREFSLIQIFDETELFLEFWRGYIRPECYYLLFFEPFGQLSLIKQEKLPVEPNRLMFFEDITKLIKSFKNKLHIEGYFNGLDEKTKEKTAIELTYAYIIQFILYKTLVDNDFGEYKQEFDDIVKTIHKNLKEQRYKDILGIIDSISTKISENIYRPFKEEQEFIRRKLIALYQKIKNTLTDIAPWLDIFVFIKKYDFANIENEIFGYIYENYLKELYEEEKKGQYFTDPAVVNFMLQQIGFTADEIKKRYNEDKNSISLIDPACGSGTFLYSAVNQIVKSFGNHSQEKSKLIEEIVNNNIFGLDIAEFPLYLAEMNILMRMLPFIISEKYNNPVDKKIKVFLTRDSIAEFMDTAIRNTGSDINVAYTESIGQKSLFTERLDLGYPSYVREKSDLEEMKKSLENHPKISRYRFDYVISNPPYIDYNECSGQKLLIFEWLKPQNKKANLNNIYGVNLHSIPYERKKYPPKPNLYAFFIALGISLLKDNGRLCYIVPQNILTAGDLDVIRYHLAKYTTIEKIITFPSPLFIGRGLKQKNRVPTSSLIFVIRRGIPSPQNKVIVFNYKKQFDSIDEILNCKDIQKKVITQGKLLENVVNWNIIKQSKKFIDFYSLYQINTESISIYYEHIIAKQRFNTKFYFDIGFILNKSLFSNKRLAPNCYEVLDFKTFYNYSRFIPTQFYPRDENKIKLTKNNQGYITLYQNYKVIWSVKNPTKFCYTDRPIIFYMGKAAIICADNKDEIFYLFSLLNSPITKLILETLLKNEQEKDFLVPIKSIKTFIRVPKITTHNNYIKSEIIRMSQEFVTLEKYTITDFVDFSSVLIQKFDKVYVEKNQLILEKDNKKISLKIIGNHKLVEKAINEKFNMQSVLGNQKIVLSELKALPIIDFERQRIIKDYIDDLVFALYFNIHLIDLGLSNASEIKAKCAKNPYYKLIYGKK